MVVGEGEFFFIGSGGIIVEGGDNTIIRASSYDDVEGPCGNKVHIEETNNQHGLHDDKPINDWKRLKQLIENADSGNTQVWKSTNPEKPTWIYYVVEVANKGWTVIKIGPKNKNPVGKWVFSTILKSDDPDGFHNTRQEAEDQISNQPDDPDRIDNNPSEC